MKKHPRLRTVAWTGAVIAVATATLIRSRGRSDVRPIDGPAEVAPYPDLPEVDLAPADSPDQEAQRDLVYLKAIETRLAEALDAFVDLVAEEADLRIEYGRARLEAYLARRAIERVKALAGPAPMSREYRCGLDLAERRLAEARGRLVPIRGDLVLASARRRRLFSVIQETAARCQSVREDLAQTRRLTPEPTVRLSRETPAHAIESMRRASDALDRLEVNAVRRRFEQPGRRETD